jgi:hypothetical protein
MGLFVVGAAIALFVGMRFARLMDGSRAARADHKKVKGGLPGARKKAFDKTFAFIRFFVVVGLIVIAALYGWIRHES